MGLAILLIAACTRGGDLIPTATVAAGPLDVVLAVRGELEAVHSVTLSAPDLNGQAKITWVVEEGTRVEAGDVLVRFDQSELDEVVEKAQNELEVTLTKSAQQRAHLDVELGDLKNSLVSAELDLERAQMHVTDSDTVPRVDRDGARLDVKSATLGVERSKAAMESARLEGEAQLELLRLDEDRAKREVATAEASRSKADVVAPSPGLVVLPSQWRGGKEGPIAAGDTVWGGATLVELPDLSEMRVKAYVDEVDTAKVAVGQVVAIAVDAHPEPKHAGKVEKVADLAVGGGDGGPKKLRVQISIAETTPDLKPGLTVRAEILVAHEDDVLAVPREALFYDGETAHVFVRSFGGWSPRPVTLGTMNDTHAVVTDGLAVGDEVALVDPESSAAPSAGTAGPALPAAVPAASAAVP